jgi:hypothetical protein
MDKETRNRIQRATQAGRRLLEGELGEQLSGVYDIQSDGTIAAEAGAHLRDDPVTLRVRRKLLTAVQHHRDQGLNAADAVSALLRECAFTTLNRFVALKMLEARGIVQECVSKGPLSSGFREFSGLAAGLTTLPDQGYRLYIDSLFDEIGREVRVLFDRRDSASLLWPRKPALDALLGILNDPDLTEVWGEDETIGWVYQYFNGEDERKQMRAESQAPRNSRELAVRNQFFTPRYVVKFLTDNTLARTWLEMRQGDTRLVEDCCYLVKRKAEVFLTEGEDVPEVNEDVPLEDRTVYVPFRAKKDPRDLKVLDPACGSGHFLLYSFDVLLTIYEEAWADAGSPAAEVTGKRLVKDYGTVQDLRRALPGLILRHNLHGVDIDPRAAQIAALALWMRAQRAWNQLGFKRADRPLVTRTNIVVAEPMPREVDLLEELCAGLDKGVADIVRAVFEDMKLAGEAGTLLRIEETVRRGLENLGSRGTMFASQDAPRWAKVEQSVYAALRSYSEGAGQTGYRKRLFADDASRGFAFIDLTRKDFDIVVMNPPFGRAAVSYKELFDNQYSDSKSDIYAAFVERACSMTTARVGVLSSRLGLFSKFLETWRKRFLIGDFRVEYLADLGHGVLDAAMVEAAAYVVRPEPRMGTDQLMWSAGLLSSGDKAQDLLSSATATDSPQTNWILLEDLRRVSGSPIAYWLPRSFSNTVFRAAPLCEAGIAARWGLQTDDNFRFIRLGWEVSPSRLPDDWAYLAKGGEYSPYSSDIHLLVRWASDARELRAFIEQRYSWTKNARSAELYFQPGLTYTERTTSEISPRILPSGCVINIAGPGIYGRSNEDLLALLPLSYSRVFRSVLEVFIGQGDAVNSGSAARHYKAGTLNELPVPSLSDSVDLARIGRSLVSLHQQMSSLDETTLDFQPLVPKSQDDTFVQAVLREMEDLIVQMEALAGEADGISSELYGLPGDQSRILDELYGPLTSSGSAVAAHEQVSELYARSIDDLVDIAGDACGFRRQISKNSHTSNRRYELIAQILGSTVRAVVEARRSANLAHRYAAEHLSASLVGWGFGWAVGRHDIRMIRAGLKVDLDADPFASLPKCAPGMLTDTSGRPLDSSPPEYPFSFPSNGILVDDPGDHHDIISRIEEALSLALGDQSDVRLAELQDNLDPKASDLRPWLRGSFFELHIKRYSKSRRKAPIYWQLGTPSASYSVWLYIHRSGSDTLHTVLRDHVEPKLRFETNRLGSLRSEAGDSPAPSQRKEIEAQEAFVDELRAFRDELNRVAPLWNPDLDDGVVINASFLHRLFTHTRSWQRECEKHWKKLKAGAYDWSHLAMRLWPGRVVPKCVDDRSLSIAHGLEDVFWFEDDDGKWQPRDVDDAEVEHLVRERTSPAVKDALKQVAAAPPPPKATRRRKPSRKTTKRTPQASQLTLNMRARPAAAVGAATLDALRTALAANPAGAGKSALVTASGIDDGDWKAAIDTLVERGEAVREGRGRGTTYKPTTRQEQA